MKIGGTWLSPGDLRYTVGQVASPGNNMGMIFTSAPFVIRNFTNSSCSVVGVCRKRAKYKGVPNALIKLISAPPATNRFAPLIEKIYYMHGQRSNVRTFIIFCHDNRVQRSPT